MSSSNANNKIRERCNMRITTLFINSIRFEFYHRWYVLICVCTFALCDISKYERVPFNVCMYISLLFIYGFSLIFYYTRLFFFNFLILRVFVTYWWIHIYGSLLFFVLFRIVLGNLKSHYYRTIWSFRTVLIITNEDIYVKRSKWKRSCGLTWIRRLRSTG